MVFRPPRGPAAFAVSVGVRATAIGLLAFVAAYIAVEHRFYATALVVIGLALAVVLDLIRVAASADRMLAQFVDGLIAEGHERPTPPAGGARELSKAIDRALTRLARTRAERQRRIDYFQTLADNVQAAILVADPSGKIEFANRAARQRLGDLGGPLSRITALGPAAEVLAAAPPGSRAVLALADGQRVLASVAAFTTPDGGGRRLISLQSVSGDLDAVEQGAWHDLVRILSHEMMNSLTPILSLAESMADLVHAGRTAEIADAVEVIARRSSGLMSFVDRYRRVADLPPAAKTPIRLSEFCRRIDTLMSGLSKDRYVDFASQVDPADLAVDADPDLLEQAAINLIKNALDAVADQPAPMIRLLCSQDGTDVVIAITDNGPGLSSQAQEAMFVPFFTTKPGGSGIGLSLTRQIALAHQGRVEYVHAQPHGAAFRIVLPLK